MKGEPLKYLHGHGRRRPKPYVVTDCGYATPCWLFDGQPTRRYPVIRGDDGEYDTAHRVFYKRHRGHIPRRRHIHHLCEETRCVNPDHLELLTPREHLAKPQPKKRKYSNDALAPLHARVEAGESQAKLARELGIAQAGMSILLRRYRREVLGSI